MFSESDKHRQADLFSSTANFLNDSALEYYNDPNAWHNQFRTLVVNNVQETIFSALYHDSIGAPNIPLRVVIGMMVLKEEHGWSDKKMYEEVQFNLVTRSALGLINMTDPVPVMSSYYEFRKKVHEYYRQTQIDLIGLVFQELTKQQAIEFKVDGITVRMDSKLIGSNIAYYSRYEIIHTALVMFCRKANPEIFSQLTQEEMELIKELFEEAPNKVTYRSNREEIVKRMKKLGEIISRLIFPIDECNDTDSYRTLVRVFNEQYKVSPEKQVVLRLKEEITAESIQSPHDPDAGYKQKGEEKVKGYSMNVTETCAPDNPKLITSVQLEKANMADNDFLLEAIEKSKEIVGSITTIHADGAYNSRINQEYVKEEEIKLYLSGLQGVKGRYILTPDGGELIVTDTVTGEVIKAEKMREDRWKIRIEKRYRYFSRLDVERAVLRREIEEMPPEVKKRRNNVEALMYHISSRLINGKTKYRGIFRNRMWATVRCLWINAKRIMNFTAVLRQNEVNFNKIAVNMG